MNEYAEIKFPDTHLNLISGINEPYIKPNSVLRYISASSNHHFSVKKALVNNIAH